MEDNPIHLREDVTVSLRKDLIDTLLGIAEVREITLSVLFRDILSSFCTAYHNGTDWTLPDPLSGTESTPEIKTGKDTYSFTRITDILSRLEAHGAMITSLQSRVSLLEFQPSAALVNPLQNPLSNGISQSGYTLSTVGNMNQQPALIDGDSQHQGSVSDEALVKVRPPVSPIITSIDMSSIGRINPDRSYTQTEAAVLLSISLTKLRKCMKEGTIPSQKVGRSIIFKGNDLLLYQQSSS